MWNLYGTQSLYAKSELTPQLCVFCTQIELFGDLVLLCTQNGCTQTKELYSRGLSRTLKIFTCKFWVPEIFGAEKPLAKDGSLTFFGL